MSARRSWVLVPAFFLCACSTEMHAWNYQTRCDRAEVRSALIRDLCGRFAAQANVQLSSGATVACGKSGFAPSSVRVFVSSAEAGSFLGGKPFVYVYLGPWNNLVQITVETRVDAKSQDLGRAVSAAVGQSLDGSSCPWTLREKQFAEPENLG